LITPDMVLFREAGCCGAGPAQLQGDTTRIVALEVKKLERTTSGDVARSSGLDYNTTPPCGRVRVYDSKGAVVDIRAFYLFACLEESDASRAEFAVTALALVDGNLLNADFDLYLSIVGERKKRIGLGTYGDGADRARPMLIFSNPLGSEVMKNHVSLIHPSPDIEQSAPGLRLVYEVRRTTTTASANQFYCYRAAQDVPTGTAVVMLNDPFPTPTRAADTRPRGRFRLPFEIAPNSAVKPKRN
jgi:hypothetical protein